MWNLASSFTHIIGHLIAKEITCLHLFSYLAFNPLQTCRLSLFSPSMKGAPITRAQASSVFMRSDSVQSVQSVESNCSSLVCEHCRCDDCILGITDHHVAIADLADLAADFEGKMRLQSQFLSSVKTQAGAAAAAAEAADDGDGLGIGGGDVRGEIRDSGNFRRKVRGQMISKIYTPISILLVKSMYTTT